MSKSNYTVIDSEGNNRTYYGCATVAEACLLGDVNTSDVSKKADLLLVFKDCFDNPEYGVTVKDNPVIGYAVDLVVAYDDLIPYRETGLLQKTSTQLLGVLSINSNNSGLYEMALSPQEGNIDNCLIVNTSSLSPDMLLSVNPHLFAQKQQTGLIDVFVSPTALAMAGSVYDYNISGLDIVLCDFIDDIDDLDNLMIDHIKITDLYIGGEEGSSNIHSGNQDNSGFNIPETLYETIVASSGDLKVCAFTKGLSPYLSSLMLKYTNWPSLTTLINFMVQFGQTIQTRQVDVLATTLEVGITYKNADHVKQIKTLFINIWFKAGTKGFSNESPVIPNDPSDEVPFEEDPRTIFYRMTNKLEVVGITDELARSIARTLFDEGSIAGAPIDESYTLVSRGYNTEKDYGWIRLNKPIKHLGGDLFYNNQNLAAILCWPTEILSIGSGFCSLAKAMTFMSQIPKTVSLIGSRSFYRSGLQGTLVLHAPLDVGPLAFEMTNILYIECHATSTQDIIALSYAFYNCHLLERIKHNNCFINCETSAFALCVNLRGTTYRLIPMGTISTPTVFAGCRSLDTIFAAITHYSNNAVMFNFTSMYKDCTSVKDIYFRGNEDVHYGNGFAPTTFKGCTAVENFYCDSYHPPYMGSQNIWEKGAINPKTCKLYVPIGRTHAYNSKAQWGDFPLENIIEYTPEQFEEVKNRLLANEE